MVGRVSSILPSQSSTRLRPILRPVHKMLDSLTSRGELGGSHGRPAGCAPAALLATAISSSNEGAVMRARRHLSTITGGLVLFLALGLTAMAQDGKKKAVPP